MHTRLFAISLILSVSSASVQAQADPTEPVQESDYRRRLVGAGLLGFGLALTLTSAPIAAVAVVAEDSTPLLATHAALALAGTTMIVGGIIRLVRTARNAPDERRRLRRRLIPLLVIAALSHAAIGFVSVLASVDVGTGFSP